MLNQQISTPIQITVRDIPLSPTLEAHVKTRFEKLKHFCKRISSCHVVIELPHEHKHKGKLYNVRIDLHIPGKELLVTHKSNENVFIAIRDAFTALRKRVSAKVKRLSDHRVEDPFIHGNIIRINKKDSYGFISGVDGNEYYFNVSLLENTNAHTLLVGDEVNFTAHIGKDGLVADHIHKS